MYRIIFLQIVSVSLLCSSHGNTISSTTYSDMESNMVFADTLADAVNHAASPLAVVGALTTGIKFVSSIMSFVDTILKFTGNNESKELLEIKKLYREMTTRFDSVDLKLKDLQIQMKWSQIETHFGDIEQKINANYIRLQNIFLRPLSMKESEKTDFIKAYEMTCMDCAMELYRGMMGDDKILIGDILRKAEPLLKYDRSKMNTLMTGLVQLLIKGISAELLYDKLTHGDTYYKTYKNEWSARIRNLTSRITLVDYEVENKWYDQTGTDIDDLSVQYVSQSNQMFSKTLYNFLKEKYFWRDWLVIVYKPIIMAKNHNNFVCDGYRKYRFHGRNIVVASVDKTRPPMNTTGLFESIHNTDTSTSYSYWCTMCWCDNAFNIVYNCVNNIDYNAADLYNDLPKNCSVYASVGVIDSWVDLWYQGPSDRLVHKRTPGRNSYSIHYFG